MIEELKLLVDAVANLPTPMVWVKYEVGCMPKFVPFIYGMVTFHEPSYGFMKYEPLYAHPAAPGEKK